MLKNRIEIDDKYSKELDVNLLDEYVGKRLKLRRVMLHMSQDELASMIGVTFQQVQKYESGANRISASRLFIISKVLQVDVGFFFHGLEKEIPEVEDVFNCSDIDNNNHVSEEEVAFEDPMNNTETLRLVNAYWRLNDPNKRQKILDFIISMTGSF
ncbi:MAG: helix-turn-helix domain-containing protein [Alphaproteobacteria bacterium]